MKEKDTLNLVEKFLAAHGQDGAEDKNEERSLPDNLFASGDPNVAFRFFPKTGELKCYALIYEFADPPRPGVLEACEAEAKKPGAPLGGGKLEYDPKDQGLWLTRSYTSAVSREQLSTDLENLQAASVTWSDEVLDRVAHKVNP